MSRKDYILLAKALNEAQRNAVNNTERRGAYVAIAFVADALASDNPRFDRKRFSDACTNFSGRA